MTDDKIRTRNFATIVYPDSAPQNWLEILDNELVPALVSPLHDKDLNPDGEPKKAHYHVILMFDSVKTKKQAQVIFDKIGGVGNTIVNSLRGYTRYLTHEDNPEKYHYSQEDVKCFSGVDYEKIIKLESDNIKILDEILTFIENNDVVSFYLLCKYAFKNEESWKRLLLSGYTIFLKEYLRSRKWCKEMNINHITDIHGEIII